MKTRILQVFWVVFLIAMFYFSGVYVSSFFLDNAAIWGIGILQGIVNVAAFSFILQGIMGSISYIQYGYFDKYSEIIFEIMFILPIWYMERKQEKLEIKKKEMKDLDRLLEEEGVIIRREG